MIGSAHRRTVVHLRAGQTTDAYGASVLNWAAPTQTPIPVAMVAPRSSEEPVADARGAVVDGWTVYCQPPYGLIVTPADRMSVDGVTWQVDGSPALWDTGSPLVVQLKRVEG